MRRLWCLVVAVAVAVVAAVAEAAAEESLCDVAVVVEGVCYPGNDLVAGGVAGTTTEDCCALCEATALCRAWTWNNQSGGQVCWVKSAVADSPSSSPTCVSGQLVFPPVANISVAKRGLAIKSSQDGEDLEFLLAQEELPNATAPLLGWFYDWSRAPYEADYAGNWVDLPPFVPMLWGASALDHLDEVWSLATEILPFNEPDHSGQSDLSGAQAAALWPQIEYYADVHGLRIGSPAATSTWWFDNFFDACEDCRVDFLATHTYDCTVANLKTYVEEMYGRYGLPIWLTEFNCGDGGANASSADHLAFMQDALPYLEKAPEIERYSWMSGRNTQVPGCSLLVGGLVSDDGDDDDVAPTQLTSVGAFYNSYNDTPVSGSGASARC